MSLIDSLEKLGLHKNSAKVYLALLEGGQTQAGPIIKKTKLHRMSVYNALEDLENRGFLNRVSKKNIQLFQAKDPKVLLEHVQKLESLTKEVLPKLAELQKLEGAEVEVRTLIGHEGFITNLREMIDAAVKSDEVLSIIGGGKDSDFYDAVGDWYETYISLLKKHHIKKRLLAPASFSDDFRKNFVAEPNSGLKTLATGLTTPSYTRIAGNMVSIELYEPQLVVIQIKNKAISQSYLESFELLWNNS